MAVARLASIVLDCDDQAELAQFWAALVGGEVGVTGDEFVAVRTTRGWLAAMHVPDYTPPTWGSGTVPKQMHIDLSVEDLDHAEAEAIRLGARSVPDQPAPDRYRILLDPAGHPFCISTQVPD